ncbi:MAG TPA: ornithine--oxo-acid transaminase [Actinomycetota bacterium]|nr:ornithine--oxo-acid transaminase [Actinomycetota bacterium]
MTADPATTREHIDLVDRYSAHNYHPLPVVISSADGVWVTDVEGNRYLDMLAAYSALNFGHQHPDLVKAARDQLERLTLTSRAFHNDQMGPFLRDLAEMAGKDRALPMNTGAEAVETAIKSARKWGYRVKGVPDGRAKILVASGNFHGRTTTIISFSDDPGSKADFGPFTPGFITVPYGDPQALEAAFDDEVVAFLVEPIQGEAGVIVPPEGYLRRARELCTQHGALLIADEIQSGLGRTGTTFACEHEGVVPDMYVLGKALGGGILPISAVVADDGILGLFKPGEHGSTFGGNPLACAIGRAVIEILNTGEYQRNSTDLGAWLIGTLRERAIPTVELVRGKGLWVGIVLKPEAGTARAACERLMAEGVLAKDTHETTIRLAPPLCITKDELRWALDRIVPVLETATA